LNIFPQPPNRTNLTAIYGAISDLLIAAKKQKILVEVNSPDSQETNEQDKIGENTQPINIKFMDDSEFPKGEVCKSIAATTLVRKLRWSTLGLQFDWSKVCSLLLPCKCYYFFIFIFLMVLIVCRQGIGLFRYITL
jgi:alkylated DNA repair protein alkB homolog 1